MALCILEELLEEYLKSLFNERVVNENFTKIQTSKNTKGADFVVELVNTYFTDMKSLSLELKRVSNLPDIDFTKLAHLSQKVKDLSSCIGAEQVIIACADLIMACYQMNKDNFARALVLLMNEFGRTRNKLEAYIQMERRIMRLRGRQQK